MTYNSKKDYRTIHFIDKSFIMMDHYDEDQDIYISERSSIGSSDDETELPSPLPPIIQQVQTPSPILFYPQKQIYLQRFSQPEATKNNVLPTTQIQFERKEEKVKKKRHSKIPPGGGVAGGLAAISENKSSDFGNHHQHQTSFGSYHRVKHPDRLARPRALIDGPVKSYDSFDSPQGAAQAALVTSSIKPSQPTRQSRREGPNNAHEKQRFDAMDKTLPSNSVENDFSPMKISPRQSLAGVQHDSDSGERRKGGPVPQRRKGKLTNDWNDSHAQSFLNKSSQDSNSLVITSNPLGSRSNNRTKMGEKSPGRNDYDENNKYRSHPNHSPSIPSPQNHHPYQHVRRRPPSGVHNTTEFSTFDSTPKKNDRSFQMQTGRDIFISPPPPPPSSMMVTNQVSYLPPISRDTHYPKTQIARFPNEYYGTLARQSQNKDWEESVEVAKFYRSDPSTRFYDRYFNVVSDKRLAA